MGGMGINGDQISLLRGALQFQAIEGSQVSHADRASCVNEKLKIIKQIIPSASHPF